jgi:hypothetical protein
MIEKVFKNIVFFLVFVFVVSCSTTSKKVSEPTTKMEVNERFPADWVGNWDGTLQIYNFKGVVQQLPMTVEIATIDTASNRYVWALIYGEDKIKGRRPYELIVKDPAKGLYINDEKNTIAMESYLIDKTLYCYFAVEGTFLTSTMEKIDAQTMRFEITAGNDTPVSITGNQIFAGDTIPSVKTYPIRTVQKAILKLRKK